MSNLNIFITGTAGFIGFHLAHKLLTLGHSVFGYDGFTPYYDTELKRHRHQILHEFPNFWSTTANLEDLRALEAALAQANPQVVVHLAAQAGVRYSLENPRAYLDSNLVGFFNLIDSLKSLSLNHFLIASTSSAYGATSEIPFREPQKSDYPLTLYAATKKSNELISHAYSHLYRMPTTAFRFFTVYGPWGRPDMALFKFTRAILEDKPIDLYNNGNMARDFTYVEDLVQAIVLLIEKPPPLPSERDSNGFNPLPNDTLSPIAPWRIVNIGNSQKVSLLEFVETLENILGKKAIRNYLPIQPGDVPETWADTSLLRALIGFTPNTPVQIGVQKFVTWFREYFKI